MSEVETKPKQTTLPVHNITCEVSPHIGWYIPGLWEKTVWEAVSSEQNVGPQNSLLLFLILKRLPVRAYIPAVPAQDSFLNGITFP